MNKELKFAFLTVLGYIILAFLGGFTLGILEGVGILSADVALSLTIGVLYLACRQVYQNRSYGA
jgi:hypothetical protein